MADKKIVITGILMIVIPFLLVYTDAGIQIFSSLSGGSAMGAYNLTMILYLCIFAGIITIVVGLRRRGRHQKRHH